MGHMSKIITMPIYGKNLLATFHLRTRKAEDLESWYAALGTLALQFTQIVTIGWPWPILNMKSKQLISNLITEKHNFKSTKCKFWVQKG